MGNCMVYTGYTQGEWEILGYTTFIGHIQFEWWILGYA
jgi:hypothetical protein